MPVQHTEQKKCAQPQESMSVVVNVSKQIAQRVCSAEVGCVSGCGCGQDTRSHVHGTALHTHVAAGEGAGRTVAGGVGLSSASEVSTSPTTSRTLASSCVRGEARRTVSMKVTPLETNSAHAAALAYGYVRQWLQSAQ